MFFRLFKTNLRLTLADRGTVFWALMFPLILATLFHFAFESLNATDTFKPVPVVVVDTASYQQDKALGMSVDTLSSGEHKVLDVKKVASKDDAISQLEALNTDAVIESDGAKATLTVRGDQGFNETIVKTAVDQSLQTTSAVMAALQKDPRVASQLMNIGGTNYVHDNTNTGVDRNVIYFYSLIGMTCLYAGFFGIYAVNRTEANLSKLGARLAVSPISKLKSLLVNLLPGYFVALIGQGMLYLYLTRGLDVSFGTETRYILLVMAVGSLAGLALGTLIGAGLKKAEIVKINVLTMSTMVLSLLAGMMGTTSLKHLIDQNLPVLAAINPVNMVSDALYTTYYFGIGGRYWYDVLFLSIFAVVIIAAAWLVTRRKTYASL